MTSTPQGKLGPVGRRVDRVLAPDYLADLRARSLSEVRALRDEAEQEESALSYVRRLLHGRIDILRAELARRAAGSEDPAGGDDLIAALPQIFAEAPRPGPRGSGRHLAVEPPVDGDGSGIADVAGDADLTDLAARTVEELDAALVRLQDQEQACSATRRAVQHVVDACNLEITRRYRDGEAQVADLLRR